MKKTNQITTINTTDTTNTTNTNNTKGEITMKNTRTKKHSFKTRLIATALSAITILSVGAMSFSTASVTASAASIEETGKKIGIDATDAAFDTIADLFPGGKILLSPFQSLFHSGVDDKDPSVCYLYHIFILRKRNSYRLYCSCLKQMINTTCANSEYFFYFLW